MRPGTVGVPKASGREATVNGSVRGDVWFSYHCCSTTEAIQSLKKEPKSAQHPKLVFVISKFCMGKHLTV